MTRITKRADRVGGVNSGIDVLVFQAMRRVRIRLDSGYYVRPVIAAGQGIVFPVEGLTGSPLEQRSRGEMLQSLST